MRSSIIIGCLVLSAAINPNGRIDSGVYWFLIPLFFLDVAEALKKINEGGWSMYAPWASVDPEKFKWTQISLKTERKFFTKVPVEHVGVDEIIVHGSDSYEVRRKINPPATHFSPQTQSGPALDNSCFDRTH